MNGANIHLFQFERDLTWMAFFMDAHDQFYARYGGREDDDPESYLTGPSLARVMREVLARHKAGLVQTSRYEPSAEPVRTPEEIPTMAPMMARRKMKCIHCHDVKVAELRQLQAEGKFSRSLIFSYPTPRAVGVQVDRDDQNRVQDVLPNSPAAEAGVRAGDRIDSADGERILSVADFARVLQLTPPEASLPIVLDRGGKTVRATLRLSGDWKRSADPSWRPSVGTAGPNTGFWAVELNPEQKRAEGIPPDGLALRITFLFPNHPTPKQAGLKLQDVVVEVDGKRRAMSIRQLQAYCQMNKEYNGKLPIVIKRDGTERPVVLTLPGPPAEPAD